MKYARNDMISGIYDRNAVTLTSDQALKVLDNGGYIVTSKNAFDYFETFKLNMPATLAYSKETGKAMDSLKSSKDTEHLIQSVRLGKAHLAVLDDYKFATHKDIAAKLLCPVPIPNEIIRASFRMVSNS